MKERLLMPIAMLQGFYVLQRTPRLPAPAGHTGRVGIGLGAPIRVVGVGDSIMAGTGVSEQCHTLTATYARLLQERLHRDVEWRVHGLNGATSSAVLHKLAPAVPAAHVYLVSAGVNDATRGVEPRKFASNIHRIFLLLRRKSPGATVIFGGLPPLDSFPALPWPLRSILSARVRELHQAAVRVASQHDNTHCFYFPPTMPAEQFARDGFHPGEIACERWATRLLHLWPPPAQVVEPPDAAIKPVSRPAARSSRRAPERSRRTHGRREQRRDDTTHAAAPQQASPR